jgi:hypothetical protein
MQSETLGKGQVGDAFCESRQYPSGKVHLDNIKDRLYAGQKPTVATVLQAIDKAWIKHRSQTFCKTRLIFYYKKHAG